MLIRSTSLLTLAVAGLAFSSLASADEMFLRPAGLAPRAEILASEVSGPVSQKASRAATLTPNAFIGTTTQVFPHIAIGESWETVMVVVNLSNVAVDYTQDFYNSNGTPMLVSFRTYPENVVTSATRIAARLPPGQSFNFALFDDGRPLRIGWSTLNPPSDSVRLGAYAVFRQ